MNICLTIYIFLSWSSVGFQHTLIAQWSFYMGQHGSALAMQGSVMLKPHGEVLSSRPEVSLYTLGFCVHMPVMLTERLGVENSVKNRLLMAVSLLSLNKLFFLLKGTCTHERETEQQRKLPPTGHRHAVITSPLLHPVGIWGRHAQAPSMLFKAPGPGFKSYDQLSEIQPP